jgi:hypothetical protein
MYLGFQGWALRAAHRPNLYQWGRCHPTCPRRTEKACQVAWQSGVSRSKVLRRVYRMRSQDIAFEHPRLGRA